MAEKIVSPGVFTREIDQSFLPAAVGQIGAALIGITNKGPAFVPTLVESYTDFKLKFGGLSSDLYLPYTAKSYLKSAGRATIVRVLGKGGYNMSKVLTIKHGSSAAAIKSRGGLSFYGRALYTQDYKEDQIAAPQEGDQIIVTGSDGSLLGKFVAQDSAAIPSDDASSKLYYFGQEFDNADNNAISGSTIGTLFESASVKINTILPEIVTGVNLSGSAPGTAGHGAIGNHELFFTASSAGATGKNGITINFYPQAASASIRTAFATTASADGTDASSQKIVAAVFASQSGFVDAPAVSGLRASEAGGVGSVTNFSIKLDNTVFHSMSLHSTDGSYISNVLGGGPSSNSQGYVYYIAKETADGLTSSDLLTLSAHTNDHVFGAYENAKTPFITGPQGDANNIVNLFKFETLSSGESSNKEIKVAIQNIKKAGTVAGSDYGSFDVIVRSFGDTDKRPQVLETFAGLNLDPDSPNYFVRRIGDIKETIDTSGTTAKVVVNGDYQVRSKYIRIDNSSINTQVKDGTAAESLLPYGMKPYTFPIGAVVAADVAGGKLHMRTNMTSSGEFNSKLYHGIAFDSGSEPHGDILPWLSPLPNTIPGTTVSSSALGFALDTDCSIPISSTAIGTRKFIMGFQGGKDGFDPYTAVSFESNQHGLGNANPVGYDSGSWFDAIDSVSNPDEIDINMLVTPGITKIQHSNIYVKARDMVEDRQDVFYVFDTGGYTSGKAAVIADVEQEDTNYAATYYPWIKIFDDENSKHVWVPPSVVLPGVIAFTDKVAHPWFAPAGLNRGGLTEAVMAKERLTHAERDDLYEARVNPIASFPGEGVCVWGQKTLQAKPSALDRVNVRRLLLTLKKFIASTSRYLVFEQNTNATRQKFLNIVNPYLEGVQSNSGLTAFRVVMDDTNNTPDVVDRNELRGQIFVQPARTAEFIVLDFIVQPTVAVFPE